jgi:uncharacterized phage protein (TIGR01671 family)
MREILYRGKRVDNGKWVYGVPIYLNKEAYIVRDFCLGGSYTDDLVEAKTIGQYIGLTTNGKKIFEGDIVTMPSYHGGKHKTVVYFKNGKFAVDGSNYSFKDIAPKNMEVIGNIYDNPELLEENENER